MADYKRSICKFRWSYPLVNFQIGEVKTCCHTPGQLVSSPELHSLGKDVFLNSPYQIERRKEMLQGTRHADCVYCWRMEENKITSPRQGLEHVEHYLKLNKFQGGISDWVNHQLTDSKNLKSNTPLLLEIRYGNKCDLKCVYCNEHFSSAWDIENTRYNEPKLPTQDAPAGFENAFWDWFNESHESLEYISFIGGEPTLYDEFYTTMDRLTEIYKSKPHLKRPQIGIISNLNCNPVYFAKFLEKLPVWTQQFQVLLFASIDTVGERAEYIRTGLNWKRFLENTERILSLKLSNFSFTFNPTINSLSVDTMKELIELAVDLQVKNQTPIGLGRNMVVEPEIFSPLILPSQYASYLQEVIEIVSRPSNQLEKAFHGAWDMYADFLRGLEKAIREKPEQEKIKARQELKQRLQTLDHRRNKNHQKVFHNLEFLDLNSETMSH